MPVKRYSVGDFELSYARNDGVVEIWARAKNEEHFDKLLVEGQRLRAHFTRTKPGSDWGCDGVGYDVQKRLLRVQLCRSGIGQVAFDSALVKLQAAERAA